jgi:hypothetical protein
MSDFILGSGLIGCIAKRMYPEWEIIPFKKSRYYSFEIPLAENHIVYHKNIEPFMSEVCPLDKIPIIIKSAVSYQGQLINDPPKELLHMYLKKVYDEYPDFYSELLKPVLTIYQTTSMKLYEILQNNVQQSINESIRNYGELIDINTKTKKIRTRHREVEYNRIISTIPLDALAKYCNVSIDLKSTSTCIYNIYSKTVDLEGNDFCLVVDNFIDFFKVVKVGEHNHIFWCKDTIQDPYKYFGGFLTYNIDILETFRISSMMNVGLPPNLKFFEDLDIFCVGSNAQWDDMMDCSSSINRLLKFGFH